MEKLEGDKVGMQREKSSIVSSQELTAPDDSESAIEK